MTTPFNPNPYGTDFYIGASSAAPLDFDPGFRVVTGRALLDQRLVVRFSTPRGGVIDCPNDGLDLRDELSDGLTTSQLNALAKQIRTEALKDSEVQDAIVSMVFNNETSVLTVTMQITSLYGPFQLVLQVTSLTVSILNANLPTQT